MTDDAKDTAQSNKGIKRLVNILSATGKNLLTVTSLCILSIFILLFMTLRTVWPATLLSDKWATVIFSAICVGLAISLIVYPILTYVKTGQRRRIEIIRGYFSRDLVADYLNYFWAGRNDTNHSAAAREQYNHEDPRVFDKFNRIMEADFGMVNYRFLLGLLVAVATFVMFFAFTGGFALAVKVAELPADAFPVPLNIRVDLVSIAAIFGAYTWVTSDVIGRNHHGALHASDLSWYALRLLIAVPLGQAISVLAGTEEETGVTGATLAAFLAFLVSMFSLDRITQIMGGFMNRVLNIQPDPPEANADILIKLPGVDEKTTHLLKAEGITTIAQLIAADPVRVSIRTNLDFDYILGLLDAAILWKYIDGKLPKFREFGLTGASSIFTYSKSAASSAAIDSAIAEWKVARNAAAEASDDNVKALVEEMARVGTDLVEAMKHVPEFSATDRTSTFMQELGAQTEMKPVGLENVFRSILQDDYAIFVDRLIRQGGKGSHSERIEPVIT